MIIATFFRERELEKLRKHREELELERQELERERQEEERLKQIYSKDFLFIGLKGNIGTKFVINSPFINSTARRVLFNGGFGLRIAKFYSMNDIVKIGIISDIMFDASSLQSSDQGWINFYSLGTNLMFGLKLRGFYFGIGGYFHLRISNEETTDGHTGSCVANINLIDTGPVVIIGWMPESYKIKFFIGLECRYGLIKNFKLTYMASAYTGLFSYYRYPSETDTCNFF